MTADKVAAAVAGPVPRRSMGSKGAAYISPIADDSALNGTGSNSNGKQQPRFKLQHATGARVLKGEDVLFVEPLPLGTDGMMFMVCDGHAGVEAAKFVTETFHSLLCERLLLLPADLPHPSDKSAVEVFAERLRRQVCETFIAVDNAWTELGHLAGTTVSMVLITDYLMTVANTGDSEGVLDTGVSMLELTESHRIQTHELERQRLRNAGCQVAQLGFHLEGPARPGEPGVGPLRIWPGGLCVSRSVGDVDAGPEIVPIPHIKQLLLPAEGCRIIVASDGLWDVLTLSKAVKLVRSKPASLAASTLVDAVKRDQRFMDDTTVIVVDVLPPEVSGFPAVALQAGLHPLIQQQRERQAKSSGGFCSCFSAPAVDEPDSRHQVDGPGRLTFLADVDCLVAYPPHKGELARQSRVSSLANAARASANRRQPDYTVHASRNFFATGGMAGAAAGGSGQGSAGGTGHGTLPLTPPASSGESAHGSDPSGRSGGLDSARVIAQVSQYNRTRTGQPLTPTASLEREEVDALADAACIALQVDQGVGFGRVIEPVPSTSGSGASHSRPAFGHGLGQGIFGGSGRHSGIDASRGRDPVCDTARSNRGASPVRRSPSGVRSPVVGGSPAGGGSPIGMRSQSPRGSAPGSPRSPSGTIHKATLRGSVDGSVTSRGGSATSAAAAQAGIRQSGGAGGAGSVVSASGVAIIARGGGSSVLATTGVATTGAATAGVIAVAGSGVEAGPRSASGTAGPSGTAGSGSWDSLTKVKDTRVRNANSYRTIASVNGGPEAVLAALGQEQRRRSGGEARSEVGRGGIGALAALAAAAAADHSAKQQAGT